MKRYEQARKDFELLESIAELSDQMELDAQRLTLMQNPCKRVAAEMYEAGIALWFGEHGISDSRAIKVAERHPLHARKDQL